MQPRVARNPERLAERQIEYLIARAAELPALAVAEARVWRRGELRRIEPEDRAVRAGPARVRDIRLAAKVIGAAVANRRVASDRQRRAGLVAVDAADRPTAEHSADASFLAEEGQI